MFPVAGHHRPTPEMDLAGDDGGLLTALLVTEAARAPGTGLTTEGNRTRLPGSHRQASGSRFPW
ncbi:hypothetical protein GCM10009610_53010 [Pseudonocardia xinjiangensis]